jgi:hypothetical protein
VSGWWGVCVPLGHSFTPDPVFLLKLPLDLLLCAHALLVDLFVLLWGQPELGDCQFGVYGGCGYVSQACGGGVVRLLRVVFPVLSFPLYPLYLFSIAFVFVPSIRFLLSSSSFTLVSPSVCFLPCEPLGLLADGLLADRSEFLWAYP